MSDNYPVVVLNRYSEKPSETLGKLKTPGGKEYDCVELPYVDNKRNVSSIKAGKYLVVWTWSPTFGRHMYLICGVPDRSGVRIHSGHDVDNTLGCLILGFGVGDADRDGKIGVLDSKNAVKKFEDEMERKSFWLEIRND